MSSDLRRAVEILDKSRYTCVLCRGEQILTTEKRGVLPLVEWLEAGEDLKGFSAADKVVGKGAAFLYVMAGVKEVYASVMSKKAAALLSDYGIDGFCGQKVDRIAIVREQEIVPWRKQQKILRALKRPGKQFGRR